MNQALNKANAQTHKGNDNETFQQRIRSNGGSKLTNPTNALGYDSTHITHNSGQSNSSRAQNLPSIL